MSDEVKALKAGQRVKVLSGPKETPHKYNHSIGTVQGVKETRKNSAGTVIYKSYNVLFGYSSVREIEARFLYPIESQA